MKYFRVLQGGSFLQSSSKDACSKQLDAKYSVIFSLKLESVFSEFKCFCLTEYFITENAFSTDKLLSTFVSTVVKYAEI